MGIKKNVIITFFIQFHFLISQNVGINSTGAAPSGDAGLDVNFSDKGLLIPRVNLSNTGTYGLTGGGPTTSMLVYNTNASIGGVGAMGTGYYYWNGARWVKLLALNTPSDAWLTIGNSNTNPSTHFLGTLDNVGLAVRTNNTDRMFFTNDGKIGIATTNPQNTLTIGPNPTAPFNVNELLQIAKTGDAYLTIRDGTATALLGTTGGLPFVGTQSNHDLALRTNNLEKARLTTAGYLGIGTNNPLERLYVGSLTNPANIGLTLDNGSNVLGAIRWYNSTGTVRNAIRSLNNENMEFITSTNTRFTILSNGNVGVGTNAPLVKFHVSGTHPLSSSGNGTNSDGPSEAIIPAGNNGTSRMNDWPNGWGGGISTWDVCGASTYMSGYITRSDVYFKKDILNIKYNSEFMTKFMSLNPVTYKLNPDNIQANEWDYNRIHYGFIANEVEKLFPDIVVNAGLNNVRKGIEYDAFIPMLVKVVQEQQKEIQKLKEENERIKKEILKIKGN